MKIPFALLVSSLLPTVAVLAAPKRELTPEIITRNLALIPATDPAVPSPPQLRPEVRGKHPRLLFTTEEIEALKKQIPNDPILKATYDSMTADLKRFRLPPNMGESVTTNDTPALANSNGRMPALAYAYALDRDPVVKQGIIDVLNVMLNEEHWGLTMELDSSMGAACNMMMAAVLFDAAYNDLEPEFRAKVAQKLLTHARRLHYLGHKQLAVDVIKYWQQDPQPNHRWYRMRALASTVLAVAGEPGIDTDYLLAEAKKEMDFLMKWYPQDGDCHEGSGYQSFGFRSLLESARIMDRSLGTEYGKHPGFRNAWKQQVYYWLPGTNRTISFGDAQNETLRYQYDQPPFLVGPSLTRDKNAQAALLKMFRDNSKDRKGEQAYPWSLLAFYDPTVGEGDYKALPTHEYFADLGAASIRDTWDPEAVVLTFKCGPYGGYRLNEYRHEVLDKEGKPHYVNLAHDDPDANSIAMAVAGEFLFHPGLYATRKMTDSLSTITVDGKGQVMESDPYTQPVPDYDMRKLSYVTGWKVGEGGRIIIEGEAGNAYRVYDVPEAEAAAHAAAVAQAAEAKAEAPPQPAKKLSESPLERFRRTTVWMPGQYVLLLDDIVGKGEHEIMWRGTVERADFVKPEEGRCTITTKGGKVVPLQMLANKPFQGAIDYMPLVGRWGNTLIQQLQFPIKTDAVKYACLMDPWNKGVSLTFTDAGDTATLVVTGEGIDDTWTWKRAADNDTPSSIEGKRGGKLLVALTAADKPPHGD